MWNYKKATLKRVVFQSIECYNFYKSVILMKKFLTIIILCTIVMCKTYNVFALAGGKVENYINTINIHVPESETKYNTFLDKMKLEANNSFNNGTINESERDRLLNSATQNYSQIGSVANLSGPQINVSNQTDCNGLLNEEITLMVNNLLKFIQYLGPLLVAVLTIVDFIKAAVSGDNAEIKKASGKFMKRCIAAVLLFFIPVLCNFMFEIVGITVPKNCIGL